MSPRFSEPSAAYVSMSMSTGISRTPRYGLFVISGRLQRSQQPTACKSHSPWHRGREGLPASRSCWRQAPGMQKSMGSWIILSHIIPKVEFPEMRKVASAHPIKGREPLDPPTDQTACDGIFHRRTHLEDLCWPQGPVLAGAAGCP
jgi:hypothetical protein